MNDFQEDAVELSWAVLDHMAKAMLESMNKDERSLLLYVESCATDYAGLVDHRRINQIDREILENWDDIGLVSFSRISFQSLKTLHNQNNTDRVILSELAWQLAHLERRARNVRMSAKEPYCNLVTTKDLRNA